MMSTYTVIIPTAGRGRHIEKLIGDLDRLGYVNRIDVEIIVVDNNIEKSTYLTELAGNYGFCLVRQERRGQSAALNAGLSRARGKFVVFTDDDVSIRDENWIDRLAAPFQNKTDVGYVAGNVLAAEVNTNAQLMWEKKGGLSKGNKRKTFGRTFFHRHRFKGLPLRFIACGANAMVPTHVLREIGGYNELFGCGTIVGHAQSHEIVYKILKAGYSAVYEPSACVYHNHPKSICALRKKMFRYGIGDTAVQFHFFVSYFDYRGLIEAFVARQLYLFKNLSKRIFGSYPLSIDLIFASILGALIGPFVYIYACIKNNK
ncbi:MAG: glycosyltransferase [Deltaproteobacteria bacterium]|nr:glycosyltransferase [Deltaproteobacteria bacterium]